jgi:hypothetical protein
MYSPLKNDMAYLCMYYNAGVVVVNSEVVGLPPGSPKFSTICIDDTHETLLVKIKFHPQVCI